MLYIRLISNQLLAHQLKRIFHRTLQWLLIIYSLISLLQQTKNSLRVELFNFSQLSEFPPLTHSSIQTRLRQHFFRKTESKKLVGNQPIGRSRINEIPWCTFSVITFDPRECILETRRVPLLHYENEKSLKKWPGPPGLKTKTKPVEICPDISSLCLYKIQPW